MDITKAMSLMSLGHFTDYACNYMVQHDEYFKKSADFILNANIYKSEYFKNKLTYEYVDNELAILIKADLIKTAAIPYKYRDECCKIIFHHYADRIQHKMHEKLKRLVTVLDEFNGEPNKYQIKTIDENFNWLMVLYYLAYRNKQ